MNSLILHIVSVLLSGASGYTFGYHLMMGNPIPALVGLGSLIGSCIIAKLSLKDFRKSLDKGLGKRDNQIVEERKRT
jgi:hypothetical protein